MRHLNYQPKSNAQPKKKHHVITIDCSGSMHYSLPDIRTWVKNNIGDLVGPQDLLSIIWFSSRGEAGFVVEDFSIQNAKDFETVKKNIDRYLNSVCLTGFEDPLKLFKNKDFTGFEVNFIFITDGMENQTRPNVILDLCDQISDKIVSGSVIEYGNYCNREFMAKMASKLNIDHIFSENTDQVVEEVYNKTQVSDFEQLDVDSDDTVYAVTDTDILTLTPRNRKIKIPSSSRSVYQENGKFDETSRLLYIYSKMFNVAENFETLNKMILETDDLALIRSFNNCINKVDFNELRERVKSMVFDPSLRYVAGRGIPPEDNGLCVMEILKYAQERGLVLDTELIKYRRIGAKRVSNQGLPIKVLDRYIPISGLSFNENSPNVSIRIKRNIEITLPDNEFRFKTIESTDYRNIAIIVDGYLNIDILPLVLGAEDHDRLKDAISEPFIGFGQQTYMVDLTKVPLLTAGFVSKLVDVDGSTILDSIVQKSLDLLGKKFESKVLNSITKEDREEAKQQGLVDRYGEKIATWLAELGISDSGFNPPGMKAEYTGDVRTSLELDIAVKGFSSIPALNKVTEKLNSGKSLTPSEKMLNGYMEVYENMSSDDLLTSGYFDQNRQEKNRLGYELSCLKMALMLSPKYRRERMSLLEENQVFDISDLTVTARVLEKEVKL